MQPVRGVIMSMGYQKGIAAQLGQPAKKENTALGAMRKDELIQLARSFGIDLTGKETNAEMRQAIREQRPAEVMSSKRGTRRQQHCSGYSRLNKSQLQLLCSGLGLDISGNLDALKTRIKAYSQTEGPVPTGAPTAAYVAQQTKSDEPSSASSARGAAAADSSRYRTSVPNKIPLSNRHRARAKPSIAPSSSSLEGRPQCPQGHGPMLLRQNRANGSTFWGCVEYRNGCGVTVDQFWRR